jgi:hypothetical protein
MRYFAVIIFSLVAITPLSAHYSNLRLRGEVHSLHPYRYQSRSVAIHVPQASLPVYPHEMPNFDDPSDNR